MTRVRDLLIIAGFFGVRMIFVVVGPGRTPQQDPNLPSTCSSAPDGAPSLYERVRAMGYDARRLEYRSFEVAESDAMLRRRNRNAEMLNVWYNRCRDHAAPHQPSPCRR
ncbi:hypothetical protein [Roseiflexus sp.]|uniref:hypothetical protein n=1 Tax=Roseiflexus sp. TaxID=2562120 RepID=UPI00398B4487